MVTSMSNAPDHDTARWVTLGWRDTQTKPDSVAGVVAQGDP
jgi:hypothetical protein